MKDTKMTDLKERLRRKAQEQPNRVEQAACIETEAADRISALEAQLAEARDLLTRLEPHLDAIVCFASTIDEFEPNGLRRDVRAFLKDTRDAQ